MKPPEPSNATASGSNRSTASPTSIILTVDIDAPLETLEYIASIAKKSVRETDRAQTVAELSHKFIGYQAGSVQALMELNPDLLGGKPSQQWPGNVVIPPHANIVLPEVTPPSAKYAWVHIPPGWTVSEFADRLGNPTGPRSLQHFSAMNSGLKSIDAVPANTAVRLPNKRSVQIVTLADGLDAEHVARQAAAMPGVHAAVPNYEGALEHPVQVGLDALASSGAQYNITTLSDDWFVSKIGAARVLDNDLALRDTVVVAMLDSGLDLSHPAFKDNLWQNGSQGSYPHNNVQNDAHGYDFSYFVSTPDDTLKDSHGTHVAGLASARYLGTIISAFRPERLDPKLKLMVLRVADNDEHVTLGAVTLATDYAGFNGARVVSASWTMRDYPLLADAITKNPRTLFVVAAGNGGDNGLSADQSSKGTNIDINKVFPASYRLPNSITVGASDPDGNIAYFSNWGPKTVHLLAPGVKIKSTITHLNNEYTFGYNSGSSQAAPFVTLAAALILTADNNMPVDSVKKRILYTADADLEALKYSLYGRLNLLKAIAVNEDLIELKDHKFYRGTIANTVLHFGAEGSDCKDAEKLAVSTEKIFRVVVDFGQSVSKLFRGTHSTTGRLCDSTLTIQTETGNVGIPTSTVHDVIWRGIPQFELPN